MNTAPSELPKASVSVAYLVVVIIWSTTPLAIMWSSESVSPIMAALLRMGLAAVVGTFILGFFSIALPWSLAALRGYFYAALGVFGAMALTYLSTRYVSSGLISLMFGLTPMMSGLLSQFLLKESVLTPVRWLALVLSLTGLALVLADDVVVAGHALVGVGLLFCAVFLFALSGVLVKGSTLHVHPMAQTVGALWVSLPFYVLLWLLVDGQLPSLDIGSRSLWAIVYLGLCGSLLGFVCYFYILNNLTPATVALITLMTPVIAIMLGHFFNAEPLTYNLFQGAALIILGLALYNWGGKVKRLSLLRRRL